jgi:hypothetical protein
MVLGGPLSVSRFERVQCCGNAPDRRPTVMTSVVDNIYDIFAKGKMEI